MAALAAGRLTKEREELEEGLESLNFELVDAAEVIEHLEALERLVAEDVNQSRRQVDLAQKHLDAAERRQEETLARTETLRERLRQIRNANRDALIRAGFAHHLRPEVAAVADGALTALAKRRAQA